MLTPRIVALGAVCLITPMAFSQVDPQARRALENMIATIQEAQTISYRVQMHGEGSMFGMLPGASATITMKRQDPPARGNTGGWRIRIEGRSEGIEQPFDFVVVSDGLRFSWLDHENKRLIYRNQTAARGQPTDTAVQLQVPMIAEASPLERELAATTIELVEQVTLDGETCDIVLVDPGELQPKMRWTVARGDGMPRRTERLIQGGPLNDRQVWTITNVRLDAEVDDSMFKLIAPDGYSTIGAPVAAQPATTTTTTDGMDTEQTTEAGRIAAPAPRVVGTSVGNIAPDFELAQPSGEKVRLSDLKGQVVLLDFWGTWCLPCRRSSPEVQKVHDDYKQRDVKVLGLAVRERDIENPVKYMKEHDYTYTLLLSADDVATQFRVRKYPTFMVIGREGEIVHIDDEFDAEITFREIRSAIDRALTGAAAAAESPALQPVAPKHDHGHDHTHDHDADR